MNSYRRIFMKRGLAAGTISVAIGTGLVSPRSVLAKWPSAAFKAESVDDALSNHFGSAQVSQSSDIKITAPDTAENGATVLIEVSSDLSDVTAMAVLVEGNTHPLSASYELGVNTLPSISSRIKMRKSSNVIAVVKANGNLYSAKQFVKVTLGGCES